jgi:cyclic-di-AMP phosphodiesterase
MIYVIKEVFMPKNDKSFKNLISRTKIYLAVIAILFVLLCVKDIKYIIPSIIIFALLVIYSLWTDNKRIDEISKHIQDVTFNMDSTIKNSLVNSPFPLIIMETDGTVLWKSTKFVSEFANTDISNIIKGLAKEIKLDIMENKLNKGNKKNTSIEKEIEIGKNKYKIYGEYVKSRKKKQNEYMMTLYFIDNTNYLDALTQLENEKSCIGFVMIDNYDEMIELLPDDKKTLILAEVEKKIFDWAYRNNAAIVKSDRKTYAYLTNQKDLNEIKNQKFDILDEIKEVDTDETVTVTLSIAISNEGNTNYEKYKSAQTAMDIVLGRGGDQAVVREDEKYIFFGGKSLEVEKRTKVKARTVARALEQIITEATNVIVMGHTNTDIDSMGSSLGIYRLAVTLGKKANIVNTSSGLSIDAFVEAIKEKDEYKGIFLNKTEALNEITEDTLLIVVDTNKNNYVEVPELLEKTNKIVVIDHHRKSPDFIENTILTFHEVYASSAAELVTEILQYTETNVELTGLEAEGLYAGIMMDTKNFTFKTGVRTFEAAAFLRKKGVDILRVKKWFQSDLKSYNQIADIVKNAEIINDSIAISIYDGEDKNANLICAKAADELLTISDVTASFVLGKNGDKIFVSGRSIGDINVQVILEKLGGGGHITVAGAQLEGISIEDAKQELIIRINEYFTEI